MSKQIQNTMRGMKITFSILLILDFIGLIVTCVNFFSTLGRMAEYGRLMQIVMGVMTAGTVAVLLFELLAKYFLIRSTSPAFSWSNGGKGYPAAAILLLLFNLGAVPVGMLSAGGEGATLINQGYLYLRMLASVTEVVAAIVYLCAVKKHLAGIKAK